MTVAALAALAAVADSKVNPGALGFIVVALLGVATYLLIRSMTKHLRRVDFPEAKDDEGSPDAGA
ncbi:MAG: hypothetical protein QOJ49_243 [Actinomycetota bacterium]|jgi:hypothetical protein|nr:hypothetical protein [Actinomycetota bacterium]